MQCDLEVCFFFCSDHANDLIKKENPPLVQLVGTSNLVDPASSHTLVSKIKPCMSKYKRLVL